MRHLIIAVVAVLILVAPARSATPNDSILILGESAAQWWSTSVCQVKSFGKQETAIGTGFASPAYGASDALILFTALHVVAGRDSIQVTQITYDDLGNYVPHVFSKSLLEGGRRQYLVPDTLKDLTAILLTGKSRNADKIRRGLRTRVIPLSDYIDPSALFVGLPVVICGYPLGMHLDNMLPLVRKGSIAGIDVSSRTIVLDADVFPGSSGSAVFIDDTDQLGAAFSAKHGASFVGLVHAYVSMRKKYVNQADTLDQMSVAENSGLGLVVSPDVLAKFVEFVKESLKD